MTTAISAEFDRQLTHRGWTFDPVAGDFYSDTRRLEWEDVIGLIPGMTLDQLEAWADEQFEQWRVRQQDFTG
jgi:hypothetical protein